MEELTKNLKKVEAEKRGYHTRMAKVREELLADTSTGTTTASNPIGLCVFYTFKGKEKVQSQQADDTQK